MSMWLRVGIVCLLSSLLQAYACYDQDYYSEVKDVCNVLPPRQTQSGISNFVENNSLDRDDASKACKKALLEILPIDEESFEKALPGFRDKVVEAFYALLAYPLAFPPNNTLFGLSPQKAGVHSLAHWRIFEDPEYSGNLNQSAFNYVLNQVDVLKYDGSEPLSGHSGYFGVRLSKKVRQLIFYPNFWNPKDPKALSHFSYRRAGILLHEARHGDGIYHEQCVTDETKSEDGYECDPGFNGPYGMELFYTVLLLHGSSVPRFGEPVARFGGFDVVVAGTALCGLVNNKINHKFDALQKFLDQYTCYWRTEDWYRQYEGF